MCIFFSNYHLFGFQPRCKSGFKFLLYHHLALWLWTNYFTLFESVLAKYG